MRTVRTRWMRIGGLLAVAALIGFFWAVGSDAAVNGKKRRYLKVVPPAGWQYQAGYTLWRLQRGLDATPQTWRKYVRERRRSRNKGQETAADRLLLKSLDWTVEELAALLEALEDKPLFQPAGVEAERR